MSLAVVEAPLIGIDMPVWQSTRTKVFMAGGITGCPDWQSDVINEINRGPAADELLLLNPRRADFDVLDPSVSRQQIEWEYTMLHQADVILFWFPKETLCPITLFELGHWLAKDTPLVVGVHPEYARRFDVEEQVRLAEPAIPVYRSLLSVISHVELLA